MPWRSVFGGSVKRPAVSYIQLLEAEPHLGGNEGYLPARLQLRVSPATTARMKALSSSAVL